VTEYLHTDGTVLQVLTETSFSSSTRADFLILYTFVLNISIRETENMYIGF
jgi:hypothetical protein